MYPLSPWRLIWKRNIGDWKLVASIAVGVLLATTVVSGTPIYLSALERLGIQKAVESHSDIFLDFTVYEPHVVIGGPQLEETDRIVSDASDSHLGDIVFQKERLIKGPVHLSAMPGQEIPDPRGPFPPSRGYLQHMTNLEDHVTIVEGRLPTSNVSYTEEGPVVEALLGGFTADFFSLYPGDVVTLAPSPNARNKVFARITGLVIADDPYEQYWQGNASLILTPPPILQSSQADAENEEQPPIALLVTREALTESLSEAYPGSTASFLWFLLVDPEAVKNSSTSETSSRLGAFESAIKSDMPDVGIFTGISPLIREFNNRLFFSRVPFYLLMSLMLAAVLYYLIMATTHIVKRHEQEGSLLRSRGVGFWQILKLYTLEGLVIIAFAVVISPFLAGALVALIGKSPFLSQLTNGELLSIRLEPTPFLAAIGAGLLCLAILVIPRVIAGRSGVISQRLQSSRPPPIPLFQRYYIDVGLMILGGIIFWELRARGTIVSGGLFDSPSINEAMLFGPILFLISVTLVFLRIFPLLGRALTRLLSAHAPVWVTLSLWQMSRNPFRYSWIILLLVLASGLGILATTLGGTLKLSYEERILYDTATDVRVDRLPSNIRTGRVQLKEVLQTIPGATSVSMGFRGSGRFGVTRTGTPFTMLALEAREFPHLSWFRFDFSESTLPNLMRNLSSVEQFETIQLPTDAERIGLWVKPGANYANVFLWVVLQDANSTIHTVSLGPLGEPEWHYVEEDIPSYMEPPLQLQAIQIYEPVYGPSGTPGFLTMDALQVKTSENTDAVTMEGFEHLSNWTPLATSPLSSDQVFITNGDRKEGQSAAIFRWGKDTNRGIRGIYKSPSGGPLPVVASGSFLASTGRNVGDNVVLTVYERLIPVTIRDSVEYFPTLNPEGAGFVVADLDLLLNHMNLLGPLSTISPNELFISTTETSHRVVVDVARSFVRAESQIHDKRSQLEIVQQDPLITGGWRVLVILSVIVILLIATLGYITYLLSSAASSRSEMGYLQALGLSYRQIVGMLVLQHLTMAIIGMALGTWAGIQMARLSVSSIAQTEIGERILPPFLLVTDWWIMAVIYVAIATIVVASIHMLSRSITKLDLNAISKTEG